ncbi:MAG TPA: DeoR/GlpR family DNA-binding transcription regulator [Beijerinckiaceae bacterium]|jgi:DeoR/GlpR family transcriptional regulator of sugar metabolism
MPEPTPLSSERLKKAARHRLIIAELTTRATVRTSSLAQRLGVSAETVRRDIEELTERGLVNRTYGGAAGRHVGVQPEFRDRSAMAVAERQRIAEAAAALVQPGDVLMVDSGSTTTHFAHALAHRAEKVTVLTNSLGVANALADQGASRVVLCPGDFSARERGVYGPETTAFLNRFNADLAFIGASGLTPDGPSDVETQACWIKRTMFARSERRILLADSTKFDRRGFEVICGWSELTDVVTDQEPDGLLGESLRQGGPRLHLARG